MSSDIRVSVDFFSHPKTIKLQRRCDFEGVVALQRLWAWTAVNRSSGALYGMDSEDIEIVSGWSGEEGKFFEVIVSLGFIDEVDGVYCLHDWQEHNLWAAGSESRSDQARLKRLARECPKAYKLFVEADLQGISKKHYSEITTADNQITAAKHIVEHQFYCSSTAVEPQHNCPSTPDPDPEPDPKPKPKTPVADQQAVELVDRGASAVESDETQQQQQLRSVILANKAKLLKVSPVDEAGFDGVMETCVAHYRSARIGVDPLATALRWFRNEREGPGAGNGGSRGISGGKGGGNGRRGKSSSIAVGKHDSSRSRMPALDG